MHKAAWLLILLCSTAGHPQTPTRLTLEVARLEPTSVVLRWTGPPGLYELTYRHRSWPRDRFVTATNLPGPTYTVVGLQHSTYYDFTLRLLGEPPPPPPGRKARPFQAKLRLRTAPLEARRVGMLNLWPTARLGTFDRDQSVPRITAGTRRYVKNPDAKKDEDKWAVEDALYVVETHARDLYLSCLRPADFSVVWTRELLAAEADQPLTCLDVAILADQLYVLYVVNGNSMLLHYDPHGEQRVGDLVPLPGAVAMASYGDQIWALVGKLDEKGRARFGLTPHTMALAGTAPVFADTPEDAAFPSLSVFTEELLVAYSDRTPVPDRPDYEPLLAVQFDGAMFHRARKLADLGRSFMPAGQQLGPNLYLVYSSDSPYLSYAGRYAALMLATLSPRVPGVETIRYVDDSKYNFHADLTALGNVLYVVYEKLEQAPEPNAPTLSHGNFIGKIELGPLPKPR
ncbi:MAG: fibronectin type III domain-containing protein [Armatimonadia bacterium]